MPLLAYLPAGRASPAQGTKQSGGKLPFADETARTDHETIQSPRQLKKFLSIHDQVANFFHFPRNELAAIDYRAARAQAFSTWTEIAAARFYRRVSIVPFCRLNNFGRRHLEFIDDRGATPCFSGKRKMIGRPR
jgi:hypothetical protein